MKLGQSQDILILFGLGYLLYKSRKIAEAYQDWREDLALGPYKSKWYRTYIYKMPRFYPIDSEEPLI